MQARFKSWRHTIWERRWWFLFLVVYKIIEDWGLGKLVGYVEENKGVWVNISDFVISYLPWITWIAIPITIMVLIVKTWQDSAKFQVVPIPITAQNPEYPSQVGDRFDALIQRGDKFCDIMRTRDYNRWQIEPDVGEWVNDVNRDVWEIVPEHAGYITADQGDLTKGEEIKYQGWNWDSAMLRVSVDRLLMRLREVRSKIRVADMGDSQT